MGLDLGVSSFEMAVDGVVAMPSPSL